MALDGDKIGVVTDSIETDRVQPSHMNPFGPPAVITNHQFWFEVDTSGTPAIANGYISYNGVAYLVFTSSLV